MVNITQAGNKDNSQHMQPMLFHTRITDK